MAKKGAQLCLHIIYIIFLLLTTILATIAAAIPYWVNGTTADPGADACGPTFYCPDGASLRQCVRYGNSPLDIPIQFWQYTAGFFVASIIVLWFTFLFSIFTLCCCYKCIRMHGPSLIAVTVFLVVAMCLFGAGIGDIDPTGSAPCNMDCGSNAKFNTGDCTLGYGGGFAVAAAVMTLICAGISFALRPEPDTLA